MKKLLTNLLAGIVIYGLLLYGYDRLAFYLEDEELHFMAREFGSLEKASIISMGNSEGKRLQMGCQDKEAVADLCIDGNDLLIVNEQLNAIAHKLKPNQTVFVNFSYWSAAGTNDTLRTTGLKHNLRKFYYCLPWQFAAGSNIEQLARNKFYAINHLKNFKKLVEGSAASAKACAMKYEFTSESKDDTLVSQYRTAFELDTVLNSATDFRKRVDASLRNDPALPSRIQAAVLNMKQLSDAHGFRIVFYGVPYWKGFKPVFGAQRCDSIQRTFVKFLQKNNIPHIDHLEDKRFVENPRYFKDANHLNVDGAKSFVPLLLKEASTLDSEFLSNL